MQARANVYDAEANMGRRDGNSHRSWRARVCTARGPGKEPGQQAPDRQLPRECHDPEAGPQVKPLLLPANQLPWRYQDAQESQSLGSLSAC